MFTKQWLKAAGIRAAKTIFQTAAGFFSVGMAFAEIDWAMMASVSLVAGLLSLFTSLGGLPELEECEQSEEEE